MTQSDKRTSVGARLLAGLGSRVLAKHRVPGHAPGLAAAIVARHGRVEPVEAATRLSRPRVRPAGVLASAGVQRSHSAPAPRAASAAAPAPDPVADIFRPQGIPDDLFRWFAGDESALHGSRPLAPKPSGPPAAAPPPEPVDDGRPPWLKDKPPARKRPTGPQLIPRGQVQEGPAEKGGGQFRVSRTPSRAAASSSATGREGAATRRAGPGRGRAGSSRGESAAPGGSRTACAGRDDEGREAQSTATRCEEGVGAAPGRPCPYACPSGTGRTAPTDAARPSACAATEAAGACAAASAAPEPREGLRGSAPRPEGGGSRACRRAERGSARPSAGAPGTRGVRTRGAEARCGAHTCCTRRAPARRADPNRADANEREADRTSDARRSGAGGRTARPADIHHPSARSAPPNARPQGRAGSCAGA